MYILSMTVDGEEINGAPLEHDYKQSRPETTRTEYTLPGTQQQNNHNHSASNPRSQNERNTANQTEYLVYM